MAKGLTLAEGAANWASGGEKKKEDEVLHGEVLPAYHVDKNAPRITEDMAYLLIDASKRVAHDDGFDEGYNQRGEDDASAKPTLGAAVRHAAHSAFVQPVIDGLAEMTNGEPLDMSKMPKALQPRQPSWVEISAKKLGTKVVNLAVEVVKAEIAARTTVKKP
jgi:hypothetical protein